jgi:CheY-like chemotaxis protein
MGQKRALVVDDSKSARVILSRMLEKYDIEVDMAESAEQALEYLKHDRPDAIFMDHLMPGMDGLQAVKVIKGNPQTAMIPIMMYTSQEGELYVGQARALGAMGVMPKQVRPVDVSKVLYELHLLPDRREFAEAALVPVEVGASGAVERAASATADRSGDSTKRLEAAIKQQSVDLRRFIVASLDSLAARLEADSLRAVPSSGPAPEPPPPNPPGAAVWPWVLGILAAGVLAAVGALFWFSREDMGQTHAELASLKAANADLKQASDELAGQLKELTATLTAAGSSQASAASGATVGVPVPLASGPAGAAGLPRTEPVPYGELPFDHSRLDVLRDVLSKLEAQNFHGVVKVTSAPGVFCLSGNATDGFLPAAATLLASKCDLVGNPFEDSLSGQQRQSLAFANLIAGVRQRTGGAISVVTESMPAPKVAVQYPPHSDALTAGEWNRAAAANNHVEFAAEPAPAAAPGAAP